MLAIGYQVQVIGELHILCNLLQNINAEAFAALLDVCPTSLCCVASETQRDASLTSDFDQHCFNHLSIVVQCLWQKISEMASNTVHTVHICAHYTRYKKVNVNPRECFISVSYVLLDKPRMTGDMSIICLRGQNNTWLLLSPFYLLNLSNCTNEHISPRLFHL